SRSSFRPASDSTYTPAYLRYALARARGRPPRDPGTARARQPGNHTEIYARQPRTPSRRVRESASQGEEVIPHPFGRGRRAAPGEGYKSLSYPATLTRRASPLAVAAPSPRR